MKRILILMLLLFSGSAFANMADCQAGWPGGQYCENFGGNCLFGHLSNVCYTADDSCPIGQYRPSVSPFLCINIPPAPTDYSCASPKEWIYTAESNWKCVLVSGLSACGTIPYAATKAGACSGSSGAYHTTSFVKTLICDPANTYECKPPNSNCDFWTSIIDSTCTN